MGELYGGGYGGYEHFYIEVFECPACGRAMPAEEALLGSLGKLRHYRCRYCGMISSKPAEAESEKA